MTIFSFALQILKDKLYLIQDEDELNILLNINFKF